MDTVKYLSQVLQLEYELERKQEKLIRLEQRMRYVSPSYESTGATPTTPNPNKLADQIAEVELLKSKIKDIENKIVKTRHRLLRVIDSLNDLDACDVLYLKYIRGHNYKKIAQIMERNVKWVYNKHSQALDIVSEKIKNYQRISPKKYKVINCLNNEIEFIGTVPEVADYVGETIGMVKIYIAQELARKNYRIVEYVED